MADELMDKRSPFQALILCRDPRLHRLLEIELSLSGVTLVSEAEAYGLCLVDLDDYPREILPHEGIRLICWSRSVDAPAWLQGAPAVWLHRPFSLQEVEDGVRRLLTDALISSDASHAMSWRPAATIPRKPPADTSENDLWIFPLPDGRVSVEGRELSLTPREKALFDCLWENRGAVVSKERLWQALCAAEAVVGTKDGAPATNALEVYVCYLRRKIEKPSARRAITTVRGQGYRLDV